MFVLNLVNFRMGHAKASFLCLNIHLCELKFQYYSCYILYGKDEWINIFYLFQLIAVLKPLWCTSYMQEVLTLYMKELPAMNFAANTGKESMFLQRCVTNG